MQDPQQPTPRRLAAHALADHPEAQSLLFEAGHRRVLARQSAAEVRRTFTAMQAARLAYETLRHRLDPRRARTVHFGVALALLAAIFAVLVALDAVEFSGVLAGWTTAAAVAAAAAWTGTAWLAALAVREKKGGLLTTLGAGAAGLGLLLVALHGEEPPKAHADLRYGLGVGLLADLLILALVAVATGLIARTEPASVLVARLRWHRFRAEHEAAVAVLRADAEADVIAGQGWYSLLDAQVRFAPGDDERTANAWMPRGNGRSGPGAHRSA